MALLAGIRCFSQGTKLVTSKALRPYVILPGMVSLIIIVAGLTLGLSYVADFSAYLVASLPNWLSFLEWILEPLLYLTGVLVGAWSFGFLATIIGSPFLGELASKVEGRAIVELPWWQQIGPSLWRELRKLRYHIPRLIALVVIGFIPVLNTFAPLIWLVFGAWMMAAQFADYSSENSLQPFESTLAVLRQDKSAAIGFGACVTVGMSIPILNIAVPAVATAGGTLLIQSMRDRFNNEDQPQSMAT